MKLAYAFLAKAGEFGGEAGLSVLGGDIENIGSPSMPATVPYLVLLGKLIASPDEVGREHKLTVSLKDRDGADLLPPGGVAHAFVPKAKLDLPPSPNGVGTGFAVQFVGVT